MEGRAGRRWELCERAAQGILRAERAPGDLGSVVRDLGGSGRMVHQDEETGGGLESEGVGDRAKRGRRGKNNGGACLDLGFGWRKESRVCRPGKKLGCVSWAWGPLFSNGEINDIFVFSDGRISDK